MASGVRGPHGGDDTLYRRIDAEETLPLAPLGNKYVTRLIHIKDKLRLNRHDRACVQKMLALVASCAVGQDEDNDHHGSWHCQRLLSL